MRHKPVCSQCQIELRPHKNGVEVIDYNDNGPYELWFADEWACPKCGVKIVLGFGDGPAFSHFDPGFLAHIDRVRQVSHQCRTVRQWL